MLQLTLEKLIQSINNDPMTVEEVKRCISKVEKDLASYRNGHEGVKDNKSKSIATMFLKPIAVEEEKLAWLKNRLAELEAAEAVETKTTNETEYRIEMNDKANGIEKGIAMVDLFQAEYNRFLELSKAAAAKWDFDTAEMYTDLANAVAEKANVLVVEVNKLKGIKYE